MLVLISLISSASAIAWSGPGWSATISVPSNGAASCNGVTVTATAPTGGYIGVVFTVARGTRSITETAAISAIGKASYKANIAWNADTATLGGNGKFTILGGTGTGTVKAKYGSTSKTLTKTITKGTYSNKATVGTAITVSQVPA